MKAFIVHTRALPGCCKTGETPTIVEVSGTMVTAMEDPSILWALKEGEFKFRITAPESLYEPHESKQPDGSKKKTMVPPVYHSHAVYLSLEEARKAAEQMIKSGLDFEVRKERLASYTEEELQAKYLEIQTVMLP